MCVLCISVLRLDAKCRVCDWLVLEFMSILELNLHFSGVDTSCVYVCVCDVKLNQDSVSMTSLMTLC